MKNMKNFIETALYTKRSAVFIGPPGCGKTAIVESLAGPEFPVITENVALCSLATFNGILMGMPDGTVNRIPDSRFSPLFEGPGCLFLDELDKAPQAIQVLALRLIQNRELAGRRLHPGVVILAAANPTDDGGAWGVMGPLTNRVTIYHVTPDLEGTLEILRQKDPAGLPVVAWLKASDTLYVKPSVEGSPFPSPRSWEAVYDLLVAKEAGKCEKFSQAVYGTVGEPVGLEFMAYLDKLDIPSIEEVLGGKWSVDPSRLDVLYAVASALVTYARGIKDGAKMVPVWDATRRIFETPGTRDVAAFLVRDLTQRAKKTPPVEMLDRIGELMK